MAEKIQISLDGELLNVESQTRFKEENFLDIIILPFQDSLTEDMGVTTQYSIVTKEGDIRIRKTPLRPKSPIYKTVAATICAGIFTLPGAILNNPTLAVAGASLGAGGAYLLQEHFKVQEQLQRLYFQAKYGLRGATRGEIQKFSGGIHNIRHQTNNRISINNRTSAQVSKITEYSGEVEYTDLDKIQIRLGQDLAKIENADLEKLLNSVDSEWPIEGAKYCVALNKPKRKPKIRLAKTSLKTLREVTQLIETFMDESTLRITTTIDLSLAKPKEGKFCYVGVRSPESYTRKVIDYEQQFYLSDL